MTVRPPAAALVAAALLLAGCAGSDTGSDTGSGTGSGTGSDSERAGAAKSQAADVAWSPCDGLTAVEVSRLMSLAAKAAGPISPLPKARV